MSQSSGAIWGNPSSSLRFAKKVGLLQIVRSWNISRIVNLQLIVKTLEDIVWHDIYSLLTHLLAPQVQSERHPTIHPLLSIQAASWTFPSCDVWRWHPDLENVQVLQLLESSIFQLRVRLHPYNTSLGLTADFSALCDEWNRDVPPWSLMAS